MRLGMRIPTVGPVLPHVKNAVESDGGRLDYRIPAFRAFSRQLTAGSHLLTLFAAQTYLLGKAHSKPLETEVSR
jgi:hypothetical protein